MTNCGYLTYCCSYCSDHNEADRKNGHLECILLVDARAKHIPDNKCPCGYEICEWKLKNDIHVTYGIHNIQKKKSKSVAPQHGDSVLD